MKLLVGILLVLISWKGIAAERGLYAGPSVVYGDRQFTVVVDTSNGRWRAEAGHLARATWAGVSREFHLEELTLTFGAGGVTGDEINISNGANFLIGVHSWIGRWGLSLRHISNGAQILGHHRYPNFGENFLLLGVRW